LKSLSARHGKDRNRLTTAARTMLSIIAVGLTLAVAAPSPLAQVVGAQFDNGRLEHLRGLAFKKPVPLVALKPDEAQRVVEDDLRRDYSDERLQADGTAGCMLGLFAPPFDLKQQILKAALSQFGGVYLPHRKEIVIIQHSTLLEATNSSLWFSFQSGFLGNRLAHELTHAIQDQHFDLEAREEKLKHENDQSIAFSSVVEGDATLAGVAYTNDGLDNSAVDRLVSNLYGMTRRLNTWASDNKVPEGLSVPSIFAHTEGIKFVAEAYRRGGWRAVDALYLHPPVSTQQIIHPQLYFDRPRLPARIQLAGYQKILPSAAVYTDTYGELLLRVILQRNLGEASADSNLAERWAGDRIAILPQGNSVTVVWVLAFSDPSSAMQFAALYSSILDRLHGASTAHRVEYRGNTVLAVIGDGLRQHPDLVPAIWKETTVAPGN